jgi:hypothetical protein
MLCIGWGGLWGMELMGGNRDQGILGMAHDTTAVC